MKKSAVIPTGGYIYKFKYRWKEDLDGKLHPLTMSCGDPSSEVAKKQALTVLDPMNEGRAIIVDVRRQDAPVSAYSCPICGHEPVKPKCCSVCETIVCGKHIKAAAPKKLDFEADDGLNDGACEECVNELFENDGEDGPLM